MKHLYIAFLLLIFVACKRDNTGVVEPSGFRLRVSVEGVEGVESKVDAFGSGDDVGVYLANIDMGLRPSGNAANNSHFTYDGTTWKASDFSPSPSSPSPSSPSPSPSSLNSPSSNPSNVGFATRFTSESNASFAASGDLVSDPSSNSLNSSSSGSSSNPSTSSPSNSNNPNSSGSSGSAGGYGRIGGTDAGSGTSGNVVPSGSYLAYGYYPYRASVDDARQISYTLPLDQSAGIDKSKSLAWGRIKSGTPIVVDSKIAGAIDVELTFTNCLARVTIKGNMPAKYNNRNVGDVTGIKLLGAQKQCKLDLATGRLITDSYADRSDVTMYKNSYDASTKTYNYSAIAIPDTILPSAPLAVVTFTYNDGTGQSDNVYLYADKKGTSLRGNTHHTITSNVDYLDCYTEFAFAAAGSTQVADIKTNIAAPYTLSVKLGADWLTVSGDSASGYSVTATANTTTINRMGELVLSNGTLTRSIAVLQLK